MEVEKSGWGGNEKRVWFGGEFDRIQAQTKTREGDTQIKMTLIL